MERSMHIFLEVEDNAAEFFEETFWDEESKPEPENSKKEYEDGSNDGAGVDGKTPEDWKAEEDEKK